jgi:opacity protein-like surface antigen
MNFKRKLLAIVASSALVCSSAFAEGFYAKVGGAGAMSMKPSIITKGESSIVPSFYVGFGMKVIDGVRIGVEGQGWLNDTKVATGLVAGDYVLKGTPYTGHVAVYYDIEMSDSMIPFVGVRVGYAQGVFGINDPKPEEGKPALTETKKKAMEKSSELGSLTAGGSLGLGIMMTDSLALDVAYNLDYYKVSATQEAKDNAALSKAATETDTSLFAHKVSVGVSFKF